MGTVSPSLFVLMRRGGGDDGGASGEEARAGWEEGMYWSWDDEGWLLFSFVVDDGSGGCGLIVDLGGW